MRLIGYLILLAAVLTGCTPIATTGPVEQVTMAQRPGGIDVAPEPPTAGISPTRLVEGFLQAMADPDGDYAIARQYLSNEAAGAWSPEEATIYDGPVTAESDSARIDGRIIGTLDTQWRYTPELMELSHDFELVLEDGQWRIGHPPDGILLSRYIFERYYSRVSLYFMSRVGSHVVPDPIHMPEALITPSSVVDALLTGPSETAARTVHDAIPAGTQLGPDGATIDSRGVVSVDLVGLEMGLSDDTRRRMGAQLLWTLTAIPRFTGLTVTIEGLPVALPGAAADGVLELATQQGYQVLSRAAGTDLYAIRGTRAGRITGTDEFDALSTVTVRAAELAVSLDGTSVALIDETRAELSVGALGGQAIPVDTGLVNLRSPQYVLGTLWLLGNDPSGTTKLATVDRTGRVQLVNVELPAGELVEFAVSPTRARIAMIVDLNGQRVFGIAPVLGVNPTTVTAWRPMSLVDPSGALLTDPSAVSWYAETSLALIAGVGGSPSVYVAMLDGALVEDLGPITGEVDELTALARLGGGSIAIHTAGELVWRFEARTRWTRLSDGVDSIAYPT